MPNPLEDVLTFPCEFPLKMIGLNDDDFEIFAINLVREFVPYLDASAVTTKLSAGGKYVSISMTFTAMSREQVDSIYIAMTEHKNRILFAL